MPFRQNFVFKGIGSSQQQRKRVLLWAMGQDTEIAAFWKGTGMILFFLSITTMLHVPGKQILGLAIFQYPQCSCRYDAPG